jgi:hypothetical protein
MECTAKAEVYLNADKADVQNNGDDELDYQILR